MSFKQNLLKKIEIDQMVRSVLATIGPMDSGLKIDRQTMRRLLEMGPYEHQHQRDLDLYIETTGASESTVLVLDNELPIYRTTPEDVVMRKSPTIKEMLNIRNAIKILNNSDVLVSKREESLKTVRRTCIDLLDLSFDQSDVAEIEKEGIRSLERDYEEGVVEALLLFSELLEYKTLPKIFQIRHHEMFGKFKKADRDRYRLGPVVMYSKIDGTLKLIQDEITGSNKENAEMLAAVSSGAEKASVEGPDVFRSLARSVRIRPIWPEAEPMF